MEQQHLKAWLDVLGYSSKENQLFRKRTIHDVIDEHDVDVVLKER